MEDAGISASRLPCAPGRWGGLFSSQWESSQTLLSVFSELPGSGAMAGNAVIPELLLEWAWPQPQYQVSSGVGAGLLFI